MTKSSIYNGSALCALVACLVAGCASPVPGPDKQFGGELQGAVTGAGAGAVTGFQLGSPIGAGAFVGAGLGAVAGGIQGFAKDQTEEQMMRLASETRKEREIAIAHEILEDHYQRRMQIHPTRDIYPADLFFAADQVSLRRGSTAILQQLAVLNRNRMPWSRLQVVAYARSAGKTSNYAKHLVERRSKAVVNYLVQLGIEPRRLDARGVLIDAPLLIDPADRPDRYNQAIELVPLDR